MGLRKYAVVHIPAGFVIGVNMRRAGGGHLGNKWKRDNAQDQA